ncbi:MAG: hypothetical protein AB7F43_11700 [Bacteriovoracia bacterium]
MFIRFLVLVIFSFVFLSGCKTDQTTQAIGSSSSNRSIGSNSSKGQPPAVANNPSLPAQYQVSSQDIEVLDQEGLSLTQEEKDALSD